MNKNIFLVSLCIFLLHANITAMEQVDAMDLVELKQLLLNTDELLNLESFVYNFNCNNSAQDFENFFSELCNSIQAKKGVATCINLIRIGYKITPPFSLLPQLAFFARKLDFPILILPQNEPEEGKAVKIKFYNPRSEQWSEEDIIYGAQIQK